MILSSTKVNLLFLKFVANHGLRSSLLSQNQRKSWTAGIKDPTKANYHVGQNTFEAELTWLHNMQPTFEPFVDSEGRQGIRIKSKICQTRGPGGSVTVN